MPGVSLRRVDADRERRHVVAEVVERAADRRGRHRAGVLAGRVHERQHDDLPAVAARSETSRPSSSRSVKSLGGIAGRSDAGEAAPRRRAGLRRRLREHDHPAAARIASDANTISARRIRAGIAADGTG